MMEFSATILAEELAVNWLHTCNGSFLFLMVFFHVSCLPKSQKRDLLLGFEFSFVNSYLELTNVSGEFNA